MHSFDHRLDPKPLVRRAEVMTELGRRRRWSEDAKAEIMLEALAPGAVVSEVARRHDVRPQQLFGWLREARKSPEALPTFVPVVHRAHGSDAGGGGAEEAPQSGAPRAGSKSRSTG